VTKVIVEPEESFESALKRFKKQCEKAGLSPSSKSASTTKNQALGGSEKPSPPARRSSGANGCPISRNSWMFADPPAIRAGSE